MINDSALYAPSMAKLIYSALTSLDGYVSDEEGNFDWATPREEVHGFANDLERSIWTHFTGDFSFICGLVRKDAAQPGRNSLQLRPCAERRSPTWQGVPTTAQAGRRRFCHAASAGERRRVPSR